jgi:hypothetical protein
MKVADNMKKLFFIVIIGSLSTSSFAQRLKSSDDALDKKVLSVQVEGASLATLEMEKELELDYLQQKQVEILNKALYQQLLTVGEKFSEDNLKQARTKRSIQLENDKALKRILTEQQLKKYLELEGRQHATHLSELDDN